MNVPDILATDWLILRRHLLKDLDGFGKFMVNPTATTCMAFTTDQRTHAGTRQLLEYVIASYETDQQVFSFADFSTDVYVGSGGIQPLEDEDAVEVYYTVLPEFQDQGLAMEAVRQLITYIWEDTDVQIAVALLVPEDVPQARVAEKLGSTDNGPI